MSRSCMACCVSKEPSKNDDREKAAITCPKITPPTDSPSPLSPGPWSPLTNPGAATGNVRLRQAQTFVFLVVVVTMLTMIGAALLIRLRSIARACTTPACHYCPTLLRNTLNESAPPCQGLYEHVCSRWDSRHPYSVGEFVYSEYMVAAASIMEDMAIPQSGRTAIENAATFYRSCAKIYADGKDNVEEARALLQKFGVSWPEWRNDSNVLRIFSTVSAAWNWGSILLLEIPSPGKLTVSPAPFFQFFVERHKQIEHQADDEQLYRNFFEAAVEVFARPGAETALSYDEHMKIENNVLQALEIEFDAHDWTNVENATLNEIVYPAGRTKLHEGWVREISAAFNVSVDDSYRVDIENVPFFANVLDLVNGGGEGDLAYYAGWGVVQALTFLSSPSLTRRLYATDDEARHGQTIFCAKLTNTYMGLDLYAAYVRKAISAQALADADNVGQNIEIAFRDRVKAISAWQDAVPGSTFSVAGLVDHISTMKNVDAGAIDREYENFPQMGGDIMNNMRMAARGYRRIRRASGFVVHVVVKGTVCFFYFADDHVRLQPIIFQEPLYSDEAPPAIVYGTLGAEISYALATRFLDVVLSSGDELRSSLKPNLTCLFGSDTVGSELDSRRVDFLRRLVSLGVLLQAFTRKFQADLGTSFRLRHYEDLSSRQLLFIFWCFVQCGSRDGKVMCNKAASLSRGFAGDFRCKKGDPMYAEKNCSLF